MPVERVVFIHGAERVPLQELPTGRYGTSLPLNALQKHGHSEILKR